MRGSGSGGFPAACNQGIRAARGRQILLLNNDVVVTTGWLERLLAALGADPQIGLCGPCTNCISGVQEVPVAYRDLAALDGFACQWAEAHRGRREEVDRLVGFCLLIRRAVVERIGLLDERFGLGNYEDDDYCRRAIRAGFRCVVAREAFVHHFGSATHRGEGLDHHALLEHNRRLYLEKWAAIEGEPAPADDAPRVRLSLCMIVRATERTIRPCLDSIRPWVDEIVVVDTGSTDRTAELCAQRGARVYPFPWCDDFSAARNESLRHARGQWLFWMDSDDTIEAACGQRLRELADRNAEANVLGYVMQVRCPDHGEGGEPSVTVVDHVKLFRNRSDLRFEGRIHEQILPAIRRAGGEVVFTDVYVTHSGADHSPAGRRKKLDRDFRLLKLDLAQRPDHPFVLFNLGMTYADAGEHREAIAALTRCLARSHPDESHVRKAYALLIGSQVAAEDAQAAWETCHKARQLFPDDKELRFREALLHHQAGRLAEAADAYRAVLRNGEARNFQSVDEGIAGHKTRHNLALVCQAQGDLAEAERQWRAVLRDKPGYRAAWRGLGETLQEQGVYEDLAVEGRRLRDDADAGLQVEGLVLCARAARGQGRYEEACRLLSEAIRLAPDDLELRDQFCRLLFEQGHPADAAEALEDLARRDPKNPAAAHNLGVVHLRRKNYQQAADCLRGSLRQRRDHVPTLLCLGYALRGAGQQAEAADAFRRVLALAPDHAEARRAIEPP